MLRKFGLANTYLCGISYIYLLLLKCQLWYEVHSLLTYDMVVYCCSDRIISSISFPKIKKPTSIFSRNFISNQQPKCLLFSVFLQGWVSKCQDFGVQLVNLSRLNISDVCFNLWFQKFLSFFSTQQLYFSGKVFLLDTPLEKAMADVKWQPITFLISIWFNLEKWFLFYLFFLLS